MWPMVAPRRGHGQGDRGGVTGTTMSWISSRMAYQRAMQRNFIRRVFRRSLGSDDTWSPTGKVQKEHIRIGTALITDLRPWAWQRTGLLTLFALPSPIGCWSIPKRWACEPIWALWSALRTQCRCRGTSQHQCRVSRTLQSPGPADGRMRSGSCITRNQHHCRKRSVVAEDALRADLHRHEILQGLAANSVDQVLFVNLGDSSPLRE